MPTRTTNLASALQQANEAAQAAAAAAVVAGGERAWWLQGLLACQNSVASCVVLLKPVADLLPAGPAVQLWRASVLHAHNIMVGFMPAPLTGILFVLAKQPVWKIQHVLMPDAARNPFPESM